MNPVIRKINTERKLLKKKCIEALDLVINPSSSPYQQDNESYYSCLGACRQKDRRVRDCAIERVTYKIITTSVAYTSSRA